MDPLETFLRDVRDIRRTGAGTPETSYYGALAALLNDIGKSLKPKVRTVLQLANAGAGLPDGGLFTSDQLQRAKGTEPLLGQSPSRGAIEVKPPSEEASATAQGEQVARYCRQYGRVLVTNLREWILVGCDANGNPEALETYRLAESEGAFWAGIAHPRQMAAARGERFIEYLKRVMLHAAPLTTPAVVAWFLASYARDAKARLEEADLPGLAAVRGALGGSAGTEVRRREGGALLPLYTGADVVLRDLLGLGTVEQTECAHERGCVPLARHGVVSKGASDKNALRADGDTGHAAAGRTGGGA